MLSAFLFGDFIFSVHTARLLQLCCIAVIFRRHHLKLVPPIVIDVTILWSVLVFHVHALFSMGEDFDTI